MTTLARTVAGNVLVLSFAAGAMADAAPRPSLPAAIAALAGSAAALSQDAVQPAAAPASPAAQAPAATGANTATIMTFEGKVRFRLGADKEWQPAKAGATMGEGAEVETGIRSAVQIKIGSGQVLTIDRASRVAIKEAITRAGTEKTTVDLPYGRVKFDVSSATVANDVQIQAPDATLAVKGTSGYMEVTPGQPTMAGGNEGNTGQIAVAYASTGTESTIAEDQQTDAESPTPADAELGTTQLDTGDTTARSGDETQQVQNSTGGGQSVNLVTGGGTQVVRTNPPANLGASDFGYLRFSAGQTTELVRQPATGGDLTVLRSGPTFDASFDPLAIASLALGRNPAGTGVNVFRLESDGQAWRLLGLDLSQDGSVFQNFASGSISQDLFGLATIGDRFFASTFLNAGGGTQFPMHHIVEIQPGGSTLTPRMVFPLASIGTDAAGITERGSMLVFGAVQGPLGFQSFFSSTLFEIDPRSNYVIRTSGPMITGPSTVFVDGTTPSDLSTAQVVGLTLANGLVFAQVEASRGTFLITINPNALGTSASPTIVRMQNFTGTLPGLASELTGTPPAPISLSSPVGQIDGSLPTLFASMGYGAAAVNSPFFRMMVADQIVQTSTNPTQCRTTPILNNGLAPFLNSHVNQQAGVGQAVNDFRLSLPTGHPCLRPGQAGFVPPIIGLDFSGTLFGRDLNDVETVLATGITTGFVAGAANRSFVGTGMREFLILETDLSTYTLRSINLATPTATPVTIDSGSLGSDVLFGLGTIGSQIFAGGFGSASSDYTIYELGISAGVRVPRMALPFDFVDDPIAGSNERGSIFVTGDPVDSGQTTGITGGIFEIDPRNAYIRRSIPIVFGPSTVAPGVDLNALQAHDVFVTGATFVGNRLVYSIEDQTTGARYFVQINPDAIGTSASPTVVRVTQSTRDVFGLGSESLVVPPPPVSLASPTSPIDSFLGLIGMTAYSSAAANSPDVRQFLATAIINTAQDPFGCSSSSEIAAIGSFMTAHVNQQAGFGQAAFDFRASLSPSHPCQPPGPSPIMSPNRPRALTFGSGSGAAIGPAATVPSAVVSTPVAGNRIDTRALAQAFAGLASGEVVDDLGPRRMGAASATAPVTATRRAFGGTKVSGPVMGPMPGPAPTQTPATTAPALRPAGNVPTV